MAWGQQGGLHKLDLGSDAIVGIDFSSTISDNVDYNELKRLIKIRTTRGQGEALTIPGCENEAKALQSFENEFYAELKDQHQRVDLFVQSKAGEIHRRLVHLDKQVGLLQRCYAPHSTGKVSVKRLERFSRAEEAAEKAGEEIRSLARFVGAQRLAFLKLLKKYRKWTGSPALETRFRKKVLDKPATFSNKDFQPLLTQYTDVLAAVRVIFQQGTNAPPAQLAINGNFSTNRTSTRIQKSAEQTKASATHVCSNTTASSASKIQKACQEGSEIDFDTALATSPLGKSGGKASYWIHPDHLVELHVLLLQYTRLRKTTSPNVATPAGIESRHQVRKESTNGNGNGLVSGGEDDAGLVVCDDLEKFARRRSSAPISDAEESVGKVPEKAAMTVRYSSTGKAVLAIDVSASDTPEAKALTSFRVVKVKSKDVRHMFDFEEPQCRTDKLLREADSEDSEHPDSIRKWLTDNPEVQPLVQLQCKRTRFVGLKNGEADGIWATLDRDILMKQTPEGFFTSKGGGPAFGDADHNDLVNFPFAVLEVRFEGGLQADLLDALDKTHLTERIRGFSIEAHAVATLCKPQGMPPPYWLPALDQDLRKIPATVRTAMSRASSSQLPLSPSSGKRTSTSTTSIGDRHSNSGFSARAIQSSATSVREASDPVPHKVPKKKRRIRRDTLLRQQIQQSSNQRYWNEYDDRDENSGNEPFAIYIDPNKSTSFPGFHIFSRAASSIASQAKASSEKIKSWLRPSDQPSSKTPLLVDEAATPQDDSDLDGDELVDPLINHHRNNRHYFTFHDRYVLNHVSKARESLLTRCCTALFVASFVLLIVTAILASVGRRKTVYEVDVGVIIGVVFSLVFALAGVGCLLMKIEKVANLPRVVVFLALTVVCVSSGVLLAGVIDG
ncbi:MAG: hypothetical protein Q9181_003884 [Wetmoreana brouardii]